MKENEGLYNALIRRLGEMVKENVELEQRVHQLMDDYNRVVKQVSGKSADDLMSENGNLKTQCKRLQIERNEARTSVAEYKHHEAELLNAINRHCESDIMKCGETCPNKPGCDVGSKDCCACKHELGQKKYLSVYFIFCAYRYDKQQEEEAKERNNEDE